MNISAMTCALTDAPSTTVINVDRRAYPTEEKYVCRLQKSITKVASSNSYRVSLNPGLIIGLSRVHGNGHARFLGEQAVVTRPAYPT